MLSDLLHRRVLDGVRVVVVVDDVKVFHRRGEGNVQRSFTGSFGYHGEMGRLTALHTCTGAETEKSSKPAEILQRSH